MDEETLKKAVQAAVQAELAKSDDAGDDNAELIKSVAVVENRFLASIPPDIAKSYEELDPEDQFVTLEAFDDDPEEVLYELYEADQISKSMDDDDEDDIDDEDVEEFVDSLSPEEQVQLAYQLQADADAPVSGEDLEDAIEDSNEGMAKAVDSELAKAHDRIEALEAERDFAKAVAVAETNFQHLPGEEHEKAAMLMAIASMPKPQGEAIMKSLAAAEETLGSYFQETGTDTRASYLGKEAGDAALAKAQEIVAKNPEMRLSDAYVAVLNSPEGSQVYEMAKSAARGDI